MSSEKHSGKPNRNFKAGFRQITITEKELENINFDYFLYFQSDGKYTKIFLRDNVNVRVRLNLTSLVQSLPSNQFFRCHKSYAINLEFIERIGKNDEGNTTVLLTSGYEIPCSFRNKTPLFKAHQIYKMGKGYIKNAQKSDVQ